MSDAYGLRYTTIPLNNGSDEIPALGFGTLIPDPIATKEAVRISLEVGFRQFDCAERYRNEEQVGEAMRAVFKEGKVKRKDVFVGTKLWNNNHRPERVKTRLRGKSEKTATGLCRSIQHPYSIRFQTRRRARPERQER